MLNWIFITHLPRIIIKLKWHISTYHIGHLGDISLLFITNKLTTLKWDCTHYVVVGGMQWISSPVMLFFMTVLFQNRTWEHNSGSAVEIMAQYNYNFKSVLPLKVIFWVLFRCKMGMQWRCLLFLRFLTSGSFCCNFCQCLLTYVRNISRRIRWK